jgi:hypothetical protein
MTKLNIKIWSRRIVLGAECDDNMNFDIGLEEMLQSITKETSSRPKRSRKMKQSSIYEYYCP